LLAEFLRDHGYFVTVLSVGRLKREIVVDGISYIDLQCPSNFFLLILFTCFIGMFRLLKWQSGQALLYYYLWFFDKKFARQLRESVSSAGTVLLEYPFWSRLIEKCGKRVILTNYDVVAVSWTKSGNRWLNKILYARLLSKEIDAINKSDHAVFVADSDCEFFLKCGVGRYKTTVIANPIFIPLLEDDEVQSKQLVQKFGKITFNQSALFVGSGWYPNREAANFIASIVAPACPDRTFFIVGDCCRWVKKAPANVKLLGVISAQALAALYRNVTFVLIPLKWGTGSSLKAVEAMAYGKTIISTPVGVRGVPFEHNIHGIVCSTVEEFPQVIQKLNADFLCQKQLGEQARRLAEQYDYRIIFQPYLKLLHL